MRYKTYNSEIQFLIKIVKKASKLIKNKEFKVWEKKPDDFVTSLDIEVEKFILSKMKERFPNHVPISEEFNSNAEISDNAYTIDPIDGTVNFANYLSGWSIQIALKTEGKFIASVIYFPIEHELFSATLGSGAYLNNKPIHVSNTESSKIVYNFAVAHTSSVDSMGLLREITKISRHFRNIGSQSSAFCNLACGRLGATLFGGYNLWDIEPGRLIASEAGASFADHAGKYIIAANCKDTAQKFDAITIKYFNL